MLNPTNVKAWVTAQGGTVSGGSSLSSEDRAQFRHYMALRGILEPTIQSAINHPSEITAANLASPAYTFGATKRQPVTLVNPAYITSKLDIEE